MDLIQLGEGHAQLWERQALTRARIVDGDPEFGKEVMQAVCQAAYDQEWKPEIADEIKQSQILRLIEHGLVLAQCQEYVRQTQRRLLIAPILTRLRSFYPRHSELEEHLFALLDQLRQRTDVSWLQGRSGVRAMVHLARLAMARGAPSCR